MDEYVVRAAPKVAGKKNCVFKMHKDDKVKWNEAKLRRENEFQPYQIKLGSGRSARRFKAIKEGGVGENASYFVFYKPENTNDTYEVCPIDEWYSVTATQRYKTLTAEEAEQKYEQRHKTLNLFSVMKKNGETGEESSIQDSKGFKVSEMDDWDQSGDDFDGSDEDDEGASGKNKKNRKKIKKAKDDPEDAPEEGKEDSDEGDFEQREVDYMSDSSSESSQAEEAGDKKDNVKGIAEEDALRELLDTDDEEEAETGSPQKLNKFTSNKDSLGTVDIGQDPDAEGSDDSSDSEDYDVDEDKMDSLFMKKSLPAQLVKQEQGVQDSPDGLSNGPSVSGNQSRSGNGSAISSATGTKRQKATNDNSTSSGGPTSSVAQSVAQPVPKRPCPVETSTSAPGSQEKMIEDLIKKYLRRKPTSSRTLLKDIKSKLKRTGSATQDGDQWLINTIATVIKRLDPVRQKINDTVYFSLKS